MTEPVLETKRLRLRALQPEDAGHLALYAGDRRVAWMTTSIPHPYPPGGAEAYIASLEDSSDIVWAMIHRVSPEGALVGTISLRASGEIGYWVGAPFWNAGFATEAVDAVIAFARVTGRAALTATVFQDNPASAKVLTKAGFDFVGEGEQFSIARNAAVPIWTYLHRLAKGADAA
ncbi:MAG: GNAT family N-acetyltransferase [Pseudomonadota bacterium]